MNVMIANEGKIFAYKDENGNEIIIGKELYLGAEDDGSRYYEIDEPKTEDKVEEIADD